MLRTSHGELHYVLGMALLLSSSLSVQQPRQEDQVPTFKSEVLLVNLTATVTGRAGTAIAGLRKDDFDVYEDSVKQSVRVFHNDETVPVSIGILFDTSGSMVDKIDDVQDAVVHFAETTNRDDDIFLMRFSSNVELVQDSTSDREQIKRAVRSLQPVGSTALYDAVLEGLERLRSGKQKKKALLLVTDGRDTSSQATLQDAIGAAKHSEAIIYALGIGHGEKGSFGHIFSRSEDRVDIGVLRQLAQETGGTAMLLEGTHLKHGVDQIDQAALQVSAELRNQYTLAYSPTNRAKDGSYRRIQVRTKNPNYTVRTRAGYTAPREATH